MRSIFTFFNLKTLCELNNEQPTNHLSEQKLKQLEQVNFNPFDFDYYFYIECVESADTALDPHFELEIENEKKKK